MVEDTAQAELPASELGPILLDWARRFFAEELGLDIEASESSETNPSQLVLRDITAIVGLGGQANTCIAFSLDESLVVHVGDAMTAGIDVSDLDAESLFQDAVGELVNTIVGNSTADLEQSGRRISLTPPLVIFGQQRVSRSRDAFLYRIICQTSTGSMDIDLVGPRPLFDDQLNYVGGAR